MLTKMKQTILDKASLSFSKTGIYRDQSLFFEHVVNDDILVTSYNSIDHKIYFYYRSKNNVDHYLGYLEDLGFSLSRHLLVYDTSDKDFSEITAILLEALIRIKKVLNIGDIDISKYNEISKKITGFYLDEKNNHAVSLNPSNGPMVKFSGENNRLQIESDADLADLEITFNGNNSHITIGENVRLAGKIEVRNESQITIDMDVTGEGKIDLFCDTNHNIAIYQNCFFEGDNIVRAAKRYSIKDLKNNNVFLYKKEIIIGKNTHVGYGARLLSGAQIGDDVVISEFSVVDQTILEKSLVSGNPAVITRKNISNFNG